MRSETSCSNSLSIVQLCDKMQCNAIKLDQMTPTHTQYTVHNILPNSVTHDVQFGQILYHVDLMAAHRAKNGQSA